MPPTDSRGCCLYHPFVELRRLSKRTGEWRALMDSCPLCEMDDKSSVASGSVVVSSVRASGTIASTSSSTAASLSSSIAASSSSGGGRGRSTRRRTSFEDDKRAVTPSASPASPGSSRVRFTTDEAAPAVASSASSSSPSLSTGLTRDGSSGVISVADASRGGGRGSASAADVRSSFHSTGSGGSSSSPSPSGVLRNLPRYKACKVEMQRQLSNIGEVRTMSDDLNLGASRCDSDWNAEEKKDEETITTVMSTMAKGVCEKMEEEEEETKRRSVDNSGNGGRSSRKQQEDDRRTSSSSSRARPDPEEFPCDDNGRGLRRPTSGTGRRSSSFNSSAPRYGGKKGHGGNNNARSASHSSTSPRYPPPPPPLLPTPKPQQQLQSNPMELYMTRPGKGQPCHTNMVVNPSPNFDDEVSALSSMGGSIRTSDATKGASSTQNAATNPAAVVMPALDEDDTCVPVGQELIQEEPRTRQILLADSMINTNEHDKKGRCVNHPRVRLRKKKLFGRGWKVLMSACPDCCVNELSRIRMAEENAKLFNRKKMKEKLLQEQGAGAGERSLSVGTAGMTAAAVATPSPVAAAPSPLAKDASSPDAPKDDAGSSLAKSRNMIMNAHMISPKDRSSSFSNDSATASITRLSSHGSNRSGCLSLSGHGMAGGGAPAPITTTIGSMERVVDPPSQVNSPTQATRNNAPPPAQEGKKKKFSRSRSESLGQQGSRYAPTSSSSLESESQRRRRGQRQPERRTEQRTRSESVGQQRPRHAPLSSSSPSQPQSQPPERRTGRSRSESIGQPSQQPERRQGQARSESMGHQSQQPERRQGRARSESVGQQKSQYAPAESRQQQHQQQQQQPREPSGRTAAPQQQQARELSKKTIYVHRMQYTNSKGRVGAYTGQVDGKFAPSGTGAMEYPNGTVKEGEWKNGRYRKGDSKEGVKRQTSRFPTRGLEV